MAQALVEHVPDAAAAECSLVSAIGAPVNRPRIVDVKVGMHGSASLDGARPQIESVVGDLLASVDSLWKPIIERQISLF